MLLLTRCHETSQSAAGTRWKSGSVEQQCIDQLIKILPMRWHRIWLRAYARAKNLCSHSRKTYRRDGLINQRWRTVKTPKRQRMLTTLGKDLGIHEFLQDRDHTISMALVLGYWKELDRQRTKGRCYLPKREIQVERMQAYYRYSEGIFSKSVSNFLFCKKPVLSLIKRLCLIPTFHIISMLLRDYNMHTLKLRLSDNTYYSSERFSWTWRRVFCYLDLHP